MHYAKVIPIKKLPRQFAFFDYEIPTDQQAACQPGMIFRAPFKKQIIDVLVADLAKQTEFSAVKPLIAPDETLTPPHYYRDIIPWFAQNNACSLGTAAALFFPVRPRRSYTLPLNKLQLSSPKISASPFLQTAKRFISSGKIHLAAAPDKNKFFEFCRAVALSADTTKQQVLFLFPRIHEAKTFYSTIEAAIPRALLLTNKTKMGKNAQWSNWQKINHGDISVIIGTRLAGFAPFKNLKAIIVSDAHSVDYHQSDAAPHYDCLSLVEKIHSLTGCAVIFESIAPPLALAYQAKKSACPYLQFGATAKPICKTVSLSAAWSNAHSPIGETLREKILANKAQTWLLVSKKGLASGLYCADCGWHTTCHECGNHQTLSSGHTLFCQACKINSPLPSICPVCGGPSLKTSGLGLEGIKRILEKDFPGQVSLAAEERKTPIILSATGQIPPTLRAPGLLGIVYFDSLLYLPDYNSTYRLYAELQSALAAVKQLNTQCSVLIQTDFSKNHAFKFCDKPYADFYAAEIAMRKKFNYPPFCNIMKIFFDHSDAKVCEREAATCYARLTAEQFGAHKISPPYEYYAGKIRGRFRRQIAIFFNESEFNYDLFYKILPDHWHIDKNPINLL